MEFADLELARVMVCEDCSRVRFGPESGWVQVWLEGGGKPPVALIYCPACAGQFDGYLDEVSPVS